MSLFKKAKIESCTDSNFNPDKDKLEDQRRGIENSQLKQDITHRQWLVIWVILIVSLWLIAVMLVITFCNLSDGVKITLLATTTANILGLPYIILKGLFNPKDKK